MARSQNIKSDGLTYSVEVMRRAAYGEGRQADAGAIWDGSGDVNPTGIGTGTSFTALSIILDREASLSLPFIGFDFRLNNTGRSDTSGRAEQPVNNVKRVLSATFSADFYGFNTPQLPVYYFGCIPNVEFEIDRNGDFKPATNALHIRNILGHNKKQDRRDSVPSGKIATQFLTNFQRMTSGLSPADGRYEFKLSAPMLQQLEITMRNKGVYGMVGLHPLSLEKGNFMTRPRSSSISAVKIKNDTANAPILHIEYALDNNRINTGGGLSRTTTSGFSEGNMFSGTNSGFSE